MVDLSGVKNALVGHDMAASAVKGLIFGGIIVAGYFVAKLVVDVVSRFWPALSAWADLGILVLGIAGAALLPGGMYIQVLCAGMIAAGAERLVMRFLGDSLNEAEQKVLSMVPGA